MVEVLRWVRAMPRGLDILYYYNGDNEDWYEDDGIDWGVKMWPDSDFDHGSVLINSNKVATNHIE